MSEKEVIVDYDALCKKKSMDYQRSNEPSFRKSKEGWTVTLVYSPLENQYNKGMQLIFDCCNKYIEVRVLR